MASPLPTRRGAAAPSARSTLSSALSASLEHVCRPVATGTRCASGIPEAPTMPTASSGNSVSAVGDVRRDGIQGAVYARSTTQTSSHRRPAQDLRADTEGSVSAAGTVALAAEASSFRDQAPRQPPEQQQQQQQQSGTTSFTSLPPGSSPTSYHSDADVARVRTALAEAGYPSPSWDDIERVLAQLSATHNGGGGSAAARHGNAVPPPSATCLPQGIEPEDLGEEGQRVAYYHDSHGAAIPPPAASSPQQQRQKEDCPTGSSSLLHYLEPSLRLQRYIQLRERELEELCLRPSLGSLHTQQQQRRRGSAAARPQAQRTRGSGAAVGASPAALGGVQVSAMATHHRRAANIVFDATGDQRFRFFPTTRTPQGISTLATVAPVPRTSTKVLMGAATAHPAAPATRLGSYHNYCHCPRPNSCGTVGGQVSYLDPAGRTLRRKADPVKRGEQMRLLWAQDSFLSQRNRPREAWRTRQITMAYGQDTSSSGASIRHG
ncbi:hypothetical protein, conserved [Leishmania shawi]|uniref:Uncharacterized protein n=1 Tax=Leishmania shawi TaxID=5680 RepID=A0ABR3EG05_9TRYP